MSLEKLLVIVIVALLIIVILLVLHIADTKRSLSDMLIVLHDIKNGNDNRKILSKENQEVASLCYEINEIVTKYKAEIIELKESKKAYKELLTSLSHDVRTPLTSLIGYLDAINNKLVEGEEKEAYLSIAQKKAYDLKEFVDVLFEWFKLDSQERKFKFEEADINELTRSIIAGWIPIFDKNSIEFCVDISEEEFNVTVDISAYNRIVNNIIQNSTNHSQGNKIGIKVLKNNEFAVIYIWDNGKGISQKELPYIFDRLYKCDEARSNKGSGLGLSIVKELVNAMNGTIKVESIPNEKTTFIIGLPIKRT